MDAITCTVTPRGTNQTLTIDLSVLLARFQTVPDRRKRHGVRYPLAVVLSIAVLAKLCGESQVHALADWAWRYSKSELAMESPRLWTWERRETLLLMVTLAYACLLSLVASELELLRAWLLRFWCHRTGKRSHEAIAPLYRMRSALSRLWQAYLPAPLTRRLSSG